MSAPSNPYRDRVMRGASVEAGMRWDGRERGPPMNDTPGLHSIDLNTMCTRNWNAGKRTAEQAGEATRFELEEKVVTAWDEGCAAGEEHSEDRAQTAVEAILKLIERKLEVRKGVSDAASRRAATEVVRGALVVLVDHELIDEAGPAGGMTAPAFKRLEQVLLAAARQEDAHREHPLDGE